MDKFNVDDLIQTGLVKVKQYASLLAKKKTRMRIIKNVSASKKPIGVDDMNEIETTDQAQVNKDNDDKLKGI